MAFQGRRQKQTSFADGLGRPHYKKTAQDAGYACISGRLVDLPCGLIPFRLALWQPPFDDLFSVFLCAFEQRFCIRFPGNLTNCRQRIRIR
jgi:hypothetical protein